MLTRCSVVNPLTRVHIVRQLSRPGEILVRPGESVQPTQIVAQALEPPDFRIVEVAQELRLPPKKANTRLKVKRGQVVSAGDILATRGGLSSRASRAPIDGRIVAIGRGRLLLEAEPRIQRISALVPGYVTEVRKPDSLVIEVIGSFIEAAWGNGREGLGTLHMLVREHDHPLRAARINASCQGTIIIGGSTIDKESIEEAVEMQAQGIVVGSIPPALLPLLKDVNLPVIATEGVGEAPMAEAVFDLLRSLEGRETSVSGNMGERWHPKRPYIVVPMPTQAAQRVDPNRPLEVGDRVRVLRGKYRGRSGTIAQMSSELVRLETGARLPGAVVTIGETKLIQIPYVNLECLL